MIEVPANWNGTLFLYSHGYVTPGSGNPASDAGALQYLEQNIIFNRQIQIPVLTMHTQGDGLVVVQNESAYKDVVDEAGNAELLRRIFVHRAGHCTFTPAETIMAVRTLLNRLDSENGSDLKAIDLNNGAAVLGPLNIAPAAFIDFKPSQYLRPFDALAGE